MSLEEAIKAYHDCKLREGELPGEADCCKGCSLNREIYEYSEQPTFCSILTDIELRFERR